MRKAWSRYEAALASICASSSIGRVEVRPDGSPTRAVQSPMMSTARWPASWNSRSLPSTTAWPRWMSGAVGSTPSLTRRGRPNASLAASSPGGRHSTRPRAARRAAASLSGRPGRAWRGGGSRRGRSARAARWPREMPMRGPLTISTGPVRPCTATRAPGSTAEAPSRSRSMPSAWRGGPGRRTGADRGAARAGARACARGPGRARARAAAPPPRGPRPRTPG